MKINVNLNNIEFHKKYIYSKRLVEEFLKKHSYTQIELPVLSPVLIPESYLEIFKTKFKFLNKESALFLTPSPELFLKRLIVNGIGSCFYLGKSFRNSEIPSRLHSFEFNMLEYYKVGADYLELADELLKLLRFLAEKLGKPKNISFDRWEKITVTDAFKRYANFTEKELYEKKLFLAKARNKGYKTEGFSYEDVWSQIYNMEIEPHLGVNGYPTIIYDYPKEFAALAKLNNDGITAQRFEFYINTIELGDCYTELDDWKEQKIRFDKEEKRRKETGKIYHPMDSEFIDYLKKGLPKCAGIAVGFDRLVMVLLGVKKIRDLQVINIF